MNNFCKTILVFILLLFCLNSKAQHDTVYIYQLYSSFSAAEKTEWTAFQNNWNYFEYTNLKKKYHIESLNCKNCESFYSELYIEIDAKGVVTFIQSKQTMLCGSKNTDPLLNKDFEASVNKQVFKSLKNKRFIVRLGQVLKC